MKKTLLLGLIAMMALVANAQDEKNCSGENKCKTEKCEKKACKKSKKCDKKVCNKADKCEKKSCDKAKKCDKKTDAQTGATKQK